MRTREGEKPSKVSKVEERMNGTGELPEELSDNPREAHKESELSVLRMKAAAYDGISDGTRSGPSDRAIQAAENVRDRLAEEVIASELASS